MRPHPFQTPQIYYLDFCGFIFIYSKEKILNFKSGRIDGL